MKTINRNEKQSQKLILCFSILLLIISVLVLVSLLIGYVSIQESWNFLLGEEKARSNVHLEMVMMTLRVPRTIVAVLVGASLGLAGTLLQTVTKNPLAETGLLGVNAGAVLGIVIGITYAYAESGEAYLFWAFSGALLGSSIVMGISYVGKTPVTPLRLVLAGVALGSTFQGISSYILLSSQNSYDQYRFWVLGSLSGVSMEMMWKMLPAFLLGGVIAFLIAKPLSALLLNDDLAKSLGYRPGLIRGIVAFVVTLITGAAVALVGPTSFLGLIAPHVARAVAGPQLFAQLMISAVVGAFVLLGADILSRILVQPFETPASVVLAFIGAPLLIWIVWSRRSNALRL